MTNSRLCPPALGLALGVFWGVAILIVGLLAHFASYGTAFVTSMGMLYIGGPSVLGSILAGFIGFVDGFIAGVIIAWLYNLFANCKCLKTEKSAVSETGEKVD